MLEEKCENQKKEVRENNKYLKTQVSDLFNVNPNSFENLFFRKFVLVWTRKKKNYYIVWISLLRMESRKSTAWLKLLRINHLP